MKKYLILASDQGEAPYTYGLPESFYIHDFNIEIQRDLVKSVPYWLKAQAEQQSPYFTVILENIDQRNFSFDSENDSKLYWKKNKEAQKYLRLKLKEIGIDVASLRGPPIYLRSNFQPHSKTLYLVEQGFYEDRDIMDKIFQTKILKHKIKINPQPDTNKIVEKFLKSKDGDKL
jgi:hypothetical protein